MKSSNFDTTIIDGLIIGRVEPHIYAFETNTIPNYLKIGDTYRPVSVRLAEWKKVYGNLKHQSDWEWEAKVGENKDVKYFRDYAVHSFLESIGKVRLSQSDISSDTYYSNEFFKETIPSNIDDAIEDIRTNVHSPKYKFYNEAHLPEVFIYERVDDYEPRPNQQATIDCFVEARKQGRKHLLMYAVMRFGKSFTSMCCALEMEAKVVLIVSAKADVHDEWQRTVQGHTKFKQYEFIDSEELVRTPQIISKSFKANKNVVICLTLQDLMGDDIKKKHEELFHSKVDLLIVDETHFGARAEEYGKVLRNVNGLQKQQIKAELKRQKNDEGQQDDIDIALEQIKSLTVDTTLHLSGTPYRILMGSEFTDKDIIAFYQFGDIINDKEKYDEDHRNNDDYNEWDNPYYGFPEMIRFAFNPNKESRKLIEKLQQSGQTARLNELFRPKSISKKTDGSHTKFLHENEVLSLLKVIDGSQNDENVFGFLDYKKLKEGKMCRHIVFVLPFCASCNAMKQIINDNISRFKNLKDYEIIDLAGLENEFDNSEEIKQKISACEKKGRKTISLTVNRMLTGSTVKEWDTMVFLKDVSSPQEYDQAIFRIQNPYIVTYTDADGHNIKLDMKPQTLLVDFDPNRMFYMQEQKSKIYNYNTENRGNDKLEERLRRDLEISPIIVANKGKMEQVTATNIMDAVRKYSAERTVLDEASEVPIDFNLLDDEEILSIIETLDPIDAKKGLNFKPSEGDGNNLIPPEANQGKDEEDDTEEGEEFGNETNPQSEEDNKLEKRLASFYAQILFFALLTDNKVKSLNDILLVIDKGDNNKRLSNNIGLQKSAIELLSKKMSAPVLSDLDYKIQNINDLLKDPKVDVVERVENAMRKFGRMSISEIVTPQKVASNMIELLPNDCFYGDSKILDIASKQGEFACALYKKYIALGNEAGKKNIHAIPTSSMGYEFTRKVFELLDIPIKNIFTDFNTYDLIGENKASIIENLKDMKFNAIVGNPPYQEKGKLGGNGDAPIYQSFVTFARTIPHNYISMIIPAKWFAAGSENFLKDFRKEILHCGTISKLVTYSNCKDVFDKVEIKGGVCYYLDDVQYSGKCNYTYINNGLSESASIDLGALDVFIRVPQVSNIVTKVNMLSTENSEGTLDSLISSDTPFGFPSNVKNSKKRPFDVSEVKNKEFNTAIYHIEKNIRKIEFVRNKDVRKNRHDIEKWKVLLTEAGGSGNDPMVLGRPEIAKPNSVCSQSYLYIASSSKKEAQNIISYLKTKFLRFLVSSMKITQHAQANVYRFVPLQDFSKPWTDAELYKKYNLSNDEIAYIESMIKPME